MEADHTMIVANCFFDDGSEDGQKPANIGRDEIESGRKNLAGDIYTPRLFVDNSSLLRWSEIGQFVLQDTFPSSKNSEENAVPSEAFLKIQCRFSEPSAV